MHIVSWSNACKPRNICGLGIPSIQALRYAFDCSLFGRIYNEPSLLSSWFFNKYCSPWKINVAGISPIWKSICGTAIKARSNFYFYVKASCPISLRWDHWCKGLCITELAYYESIFNSLHSDTLSTDLMDSNGWKLPPSCHDAVKNSILQIPIFSDLSAPCLNWFPDSGGSFKTFMHDFYKNENIIFLA